MKHKPSSSNHINCRETHTECSLIRRNSTKSTILSHLSTNSPSEDLETLMIISTKTVLDMHVAKTQEERTQFDFQVLSLV